MSAGLAQLTACLRSNFYQELEQKCSTLCNAVNEHARKKGYAFKMHQIGSIYWIAFSDAEHIRTAEAIDPNNMSFFRTMYHALLERGIYMGPSGYEVGFVSEAHTAGDLQTTIVAMCEALDLAHQ